MSTLTLQYQNIIVFLKHKVTNTMFCDSLSEATEFVRSGARDTRLAFCETFR